MIPTRSSVPIPCSSCSPCSENFIETEEYSASPWRGPRVLVAIIRYQLSIYGNSSSKLKINAVWCMMFYGPTSGNKVGNSSPNIHSQFTVACNLSCRFALVKLRQYEAIALHPRLNQLSSCLEAGADIDSLSDGCVRI